MTRAQTRTFVYDSLKRLTQATNPESGTIKYEYDDNGNLTKKTDPRKVTPSPLVYVETTYTYDALNRVDTAREVNGVTTWTQNFDYDQYGNRCLRSTPSLPCTPAVNTANNRLTGMSYDLAGNPLSAFQLFYFFRQYWNCFK